MSGASTLVMPDMGRYKTPSPKRTPPRSQQSLNRRSILRKTHPPADAPRKNRTVHFKLSAEELRKRLTMQARFTLAKTAQEPLPGILRRHTTSRSWLKGALPLPTPPLLASVPVPEPLEPKDDETSDGESDPSGSDDTGEPGSSTDDAASPGTIGSPTCKSPPYSLPLSPAARRIVEQATEKAREEAEQAAHLLALQYPVTFCSGKKPPPRARRPRGRPKKNAALAAGRQKDSALTNVRGSTLKGSGRKGPRTSGTSKGKALPSTILALLSVSLGSKPIPGQPY